MGTTITGDKAQFSLNSLWPGYSQGIARLEALSVVTEVCRFDRTVPQGLKPSSLSIYGTA